ncbi:hypothetical protein PHLGIDRAFT_16025 [Phlebiopsis gigantea 11061_1 CR5-6]|uniref:DUF6532 domain-containing protein n=1 Tax=Phlebiopsis gigantea (strain 11061_1 CR5-6) TaxID=745531 RepID=A0A0C3NEW1_PHLG1|nr:hypothetical protein PHLGIDRAFT_16025 [Phlebiopsis gigantea 11061_1 CR5-6]
MPSNPRPGKAERGKKKKERELAEQEEAERISQLSRPSKERAKAAKVWMTTQNPRVLRPKKVAMEGDEPVKGNKKSKPKSEKTKARKQKEIDTAELSRKSVNDVVVYKIDRSAGKSGSQKAHTKRKQKPDNHPVFNHALLESDAPTTAHHKPLAQKQVTVKPPRKQSNVAKLDSKSIGKSKSAAVSAKPSKATDSDESDEESDEDSSSDDESGDEDSDSDDEDLESEASSGDELPDTYSAESNASEQADDDYKEEDNDEDEEDDDDDDKNTSLDEEEALDAAATLHDGTSTSNKVLVIGKVSGVSHEDDSFEDRQSVPVHSHTRASDDEDDYNRSGGNGSDDDSGDDDTPSLPLIKKRKPKAQKTHEKPSKKQKRLEERPRMREAVQPQSTSAKSTKGRPPISHIGRATLENLTKWELDYHQDTRLKYNEKKEFNLNTQSDHIKKFGQAVIKKFYVVQAFEHGFFPVKEKFILQRQLVLDVARDLKVSKHVRDRLRNNDRYVKQFMKLADLRNLQFIGKALKRTAETYVQAEYGLPVALTTQQVANGPPGVTEDQLRLRLTKERVALLQTKLAFAHSRVTVSSLGEPIADGAYILDRPIIGDIIKVVYFVGDKNGRNSLASEFPNRFQSSDHYKQHEKELPDAMVALACAGISEALRNWSTGERVPVKVNSTTAEEQYTVCMHVLGELRHDRPTRYHEVMHNLYLAATSGGMPQVRERSENMQGAMRMIRFTDAPETAPSNPAASGASTATGLQVQVVAPSPPSGEEPAPSEMVKRMLGTRTWGVAMAAAQPEAVDVVRLLNVTPVASSSTPTSVLSELTPSPVLSEPTVNTSTRKSTRAEGKRKEPST